MGDGLHQVVGDHELALGGDERARREPRGPCVDGSRFEEHRVPRLTVEREAGELVGHRAQHGDGIHRRRGGDSRRHRGQHGMRRGHIGGERLPLGVPPRATDVGEHRQHATSRHERGGVAVDRSEPRH